MVFSKKIGFMASWINLFYASLSRNLLTGNGNNGDVHNFYL